MSVIENAPGMLESDIARAANEEHQPLHDAVNNDLPHAIQSALRLFDVRLTLSELLSDMPRCPEHSAEQNAWAVQLLQCRGVVAVWQPLPLAEVKSFLLPAVMRLGNSFAVLTQYGEKVCHAIIPSLSDKPVEIATEQVLSTYGGELLLIRPQSHLDNRADDLVKTGEKHWFWSTLWRYKGYMFEAAALSIIINVLVLAMSIFTMTVYNRVLPNQTYVTLWTMAIGVSIALLFEFCARVARAWVTDRAGKKIDLVLGSRIFRHVLEGKMENRAQSNGAFGNVMQSFETVRDLSTSAALTTVADLPFVFLFLAVIYLVAGPLVWCVVLILLVIVTIVLLMQIPLKRHAEESMKVGSNRYGLVIETLDNLETIKALRAESLVAGKHDTASVKLSAVSMKSRFLSTLGTTAIQTTQQFGTVLLLLWGVYLVGDGAISMGGIIATMTLMGRAVMPIATLAALGLRIQQACTSLNILNKLMQTPAEVNRKKVYVQLPQGSQSEIDCRNMSFTYRQGLPAVIDHVDLQLKHGERVAILGKMGSGKSSLLRLLVGLYQPSEGVISLSGVDLRQIAPAELRSRIALVSQEPKLMFGTLRDNLLMGAPYASDADMMRVAALTGVNEIVARHPMGYGMTIGEKGETLSGGQKQAIALARAILAEPDVLLLDEPTSGMDMGSERMVLQALEPIMVGRTVVIVTHRPAILKYVDRVIVMDDGMKVADGPKEEIVRLLNEGRIPAASVLRDAAKPKPVMADSTVQA
ncbi:MULTISPECIES: type I secretion system permease/ATPase [Tenebrionibacter/Tenebrionicola group]|jgi:ATP-binding cassette subfamily C protein LapB|uniref:Type I secretion system permease/ATPase n=2 Tax=Tenebrionibacter/Tenebrionicola group TaxID=2969848 RepID=A0A8K0V415_9ENTR|nr:MULTISPECIES: type I secretion system permease/ATPase [Tenebrionibacter/Tenebrionicola group]MBK4716663.1 type I secretion system permease/ATPase [Tenebrionibacter intestinalis]MBV4412153.1 type I secretion system permease/ATPase [Tenebrionicola larvae]MBV5097266.1 type I secretion system permease/ATPase [Tenebrionicola larvae]